MEMKIHLQIQTLLLSMPKNYDVLSVIISQVHKRNCPGKKAILIQVFFPLWFSMDKYNDKFHSFNNSGATKKTHVLIMGS